MFILVQRFKQPALIVCDSWFRTDPLQKDARSKVNLSVNIRSRLRISAILYDIPGFVYGQNGHHPKFGKQLDSVKVLSAQLHDQP